ncbi:hypothetical protein NQ314_020456 [Rhamnusium bicolor]|uniref:Uncharacterized protein n=1 Tax=Rhamnusium bicolor TaxID=1586634 RepID=A0AAV8WLS2_9CUCU|nr:hypothetical protein NQ314_020456 [Rhamnusium bicolor]
MRLTKQSYSEKIAEINKGYNDKIKELQAELESKTEFNKRWIKETKLITENLEKLISDLKIEIHRLRKENKNLREKLHECGNKIEQYKVFVQLVTKDVNKISNMTVASADVI